MDNRRQIIVINKEFQQHYAMIAVAMTVLLTNLFIIARLLLPFGAPLDFTLGMALSVGAVELVLIAVVWYGSLKGSHKVAGPVFVIARQVGLVGAGDFTARIKLRERDMFQDEAGKINVALDQVQAKIDTLKVLANELQAAQAAGQETGSQVELLVKELASMRTTEEG